MGLLHQIAGIRSPIDYALIGYLSRLAIEDAPDNPIASNGLLLHLGVRLGPDSNLSPMASEPDAGLRQSLMAIPYRKEDADEQQRQLEESLRVARHFKDKSVNERLYQPAGELKAERHQLQSKPLSEYDTRNKQIVLLSPPGGGKSEELKWMCRSLAGEALRGIEEAAGKAATLRVPIYIRLPQLGRALDKLARARNARWLKDLGCTQGQRIHENHVTLMAAAILWVLAKGGDSDPEANGEIEQLKMPKLLVPLFWQRLCQPVPDQLLLCLDALDEVDSKYRARLIKLLRSYASASQITGKAEIWVSSRVYGYAGSPLWLRSTQSGEQGLELELLAFTPSQREAFITRFFHKTPQKGEELNQQLRTNFQVAEMIRNPLIAILVCSLAAGMEEGVNLPMRRVEVYRRVLEMLLGAAEQRRRGQSASIHPEQIREECANALECLRRVAASTAGDVLTGDFEKLVAVEQWWKKLPKHNHFKRQVRGDSLLDYFRKSAVLSAIGDGRFMFVHRTFHEYLIASYCAGEAIEGKHEAIIRLLDRWAWSPEHAEILRLFIGEIGEFNNTQANAENSANILKSLIWRWITPSRQIDSSHRNDFFGHRTALASALVEVKPARRQPGGDLAELSQHVCVSVLNAFIRPDGPCSIHDIDSHPLHASLPSVAILNGNVGRPDSPTYVTEWLETALEAEMTERSWAYFFVSKMGGPIATERIAESLCMRISKADAFDLQWCTHALGRIIQAAARLENWSSRVLPMCLRNLRWHEESEYSGGWSADGSVWMVLGNFREELIRLPEWSTQILPVLLESLSQSEYELTQPDGKRYLAVVTFLAGLGEEPGAPVKYPDKGELDSYFFSIKPCHPLTKAKEWPDRIRPALIDFIGKCRSDWYASSQIVELLCRRSHSFTTWPEWTNQILPLVLNRLEGVQSIDYGNTDSLWSWQMARDCFCQIGGDLVDLPEWRSQILPTWLQMLQPGRLSEARKSGGSKPTSYRPLVVVYLFQIVGPRVLETKEWETEIFPRWLDCLEQPDATWSEKDEDLRHAARTLFQEFTDGILKITEWRRIILATLFRMLKRGEWSSDLLALLDDWGQALVCQPEWKTDLLPRCQEVLRQQSESFGGAIYNNQENVIQLLACLGRYSHPDGDWRTESLPLLLEILDRGLRDPSENNLDLSCAVLIALQFVGDSLIKSPDIKASVFPHLIAYFEKHVPICDGLVVDLLADGGLGIRMLPEWRNWVLPALIRSLVQPQHEWPKPDANLQTRVLHFLKSWGRELLSIPEWEDKILPAILDCVENPPLSYLMHEKSDLWKHFIALFKHIGAEVTRLKCWQPRLWPAFLECLEQPSNRWQIKDLSLSIELLELLTELSAHLLSLPEFESRLVPILIQNAVPPRPEWGDAQRMTYTSLDFLEKLGRIPKWRNRWSQMVAPCLLETIVPSEKSNWTWNKRFSQRVSGVIADHMMQPVVREFLVKFANTQLNLGADELWKRPTKAAQAILIILGSEWRLLRDPNDADNLL